MLSRYDGLKYCEIAQKLSISVKTVEMQMSIALKKLRNLETERNHYFKFESTGKKRRL